MGFVSRNGSTRGKLCQTRIPWKSCNQGHFPKNWQRRLQSMTQKDIIASIQSLKQDDAGVEQRIDDLETFGIDGFGQPNTIGK